MAAPSMRRVMPVTIDEEMWQIATGDVEAPFCDPNPSQKKFFTEFQLDPGRFQTSRLRYDQLLAASDRLPPVSEIPLRSFVSLVAKLVKIRYPYCSKITGRERTWEELESHGGIEASDFINKHITDPLDLVYLVQWGVGEAGIELPSPVSRLLDEGDAPVLGDFATFLALGRR